MFLPCLKNNDQSLYLSFLYYYYYYYIYYYGTYGTYYYVLLFYSDSE